MRDLRAHDQILARPLDGDDHVAAALGDPEGDHLDADKARGDRDQVMGQVGDQALPLGRGAGWQHGQPQDHDETGQRAARRRHERPTGPIEYRSSGVTTRS